MLRFSRDQLSALQDRSLETFLKRAAEFFAAEDPDLFDTLSPDQRLAFAAACHARARDAGFLDAAGIYAWMDFSILLGSRFHEDPFYPELRHELRTLSVFEQTAALLRMQGWISAYLREVRGEANALGVAALNRVRAFHDRHPPGSTGPAIRATPDAMCALTASLYPEIGARHGDEAVAARAAAMIERCRTEHGLDDDWSLVFMGIMSIAFGWGFDRDELYLWISKRLDPAQGGAPRQRVKTLASATMIWVDRVLARAGAAS